MHIESIVAYSLANKINQYSYDMNTNLKFVKTNSDISKLSNLLQIRALCKSGEIKPEIKSRQRLKQDFPSWTIDKQYDFIKTLIKASCGENESFKYPEYLANGADSFEPLLKALGKQS